MEIMRSCSCSEDACATNKRFSVAFLNHDEKAKDMHNHDLLEIYFSISGGKWFVIDDSIYPMHDNDVFIINQFQTHRPEVLDDNRHQRYVFTIMPPFLDSISSPSTNLLQLFYNSEDFSRRISLNNLQAKQMMQMIGKLESVQGHGADLLENSILTEIVLMLLNISQPTGSNVILSDNKYIADILSYIDNSLAKDLSLDALSAEFFLSKGYFCRLFKEHTGTTVNKYVLAKRIAAAKKLLATGHSVQETALRTGFNDYASFIRRFTQDVGISPKRYSRENNMLTTQN
ncbi:AraC family transcriptional regulator, partial [Ruminococcaceae bacterium OttesenSCG-928-A16]|nr:AraC family transcriptional regulator [Ruminococcaceae bacterium OttesenSCG-928-A16]